MRMAKYIEQELIKNACDWLDRALDNFRLGTQQVNFVDKLKFIDSFKKQWRNSYGTRR